MIIQTIILFSSFLKMKTLFSANQDIISDIDIYAVHVIDMYFAFHLLNNFLKFLNKKLKLLCELCADDKPLNIDNNFL